METGIDIVKIDRMAKHIDDENFYEKYFSKNEIDYIKTKHNPLETLAGMYATKESVLKAFGIGIGAGLKLAEISICHDEFGKPFVEITPQIQYYLGLKNCNQISICISHDGEYAVAICVIC